MDKIKNLDKKPNQNIKYMIWGALLFLVFLISPMVSRLIIHDKFTCTKYDAELKYAIFEILEERGQVNDYDKENYFSIIKITKIFKTSNYFQWGEQSCEGEFEYKGNVGWLNRFEITHFITYYKIKIS